LRSIGLSVFGIKFYFGDFNLIYKKIMQGGLLVAPSGPGLATIANDSRYFSSLLGSDIAIFDSGFLCILINLLTKYKVEKLSGYKFLALLLSRFKDDKVSLLTIEPSLEQAKINKKYLLSMGIKSLEQYIAPIYKDGLEDTKLVTKIRDIKPKIILLNIGGGVQEPLGFYLKSRLEYKPAIICTGAAISFFTKQQAPISHQIDNFYLGWFLRCLHNPVIFLPRYIKAIKLLFVFIRHRNEISLLHSQED
jgi:N-acetylglucosaminyldiphosphoundecaprenol N-acetyl-beta-D-mannosaminyltransferase